MAEQRARERTAEREREREGEGRREKKKLRVWGATWEREGGKKRGLAEGEMK